MRTKIATELRLTHPRLYHTWQRMRTKCYCPSSQDFHNYGDKGILVDEIWDTFPPFAEWAMKQGYQDDPLKGCFSVKRFNDTDDFGPSTCYLERNKPRR